MNNFLRLLFLTGTVLLCSAATGQYHFDFNQNCEEAYRRIIILQPESGRSLIKEEKLRNPQNLVPVLLESYIDFFYLFFNEDPELYSNFKKVQPERQALIDKGPDSSPYKLFAKSILHLHWASVQMKFGNNWDAGWNFRRAYILNRENIKKFPDFLPSVVPMGALEIAIGAVPDGYKWVVGLLGVKGDIFSGMQKLESFIASHHKDAELFRNEAIFYFLYLKFYIQNDKQGVLNYIRNHKLDLINNHLFAYLAANLSINAQQSAQAGVIIRNRNRSSEYLQTPVWDLEYGYVRLYHLQPDAAVYLERFINNFKGNFYLKDALQKLSWHYYLQGDLQKAREYRKMIGEKGMAITEADKQALKDASSDKWPNKLLLQVRLLNDGGYLREALGRLHGKSVHDFETIEEKLEFSYRVGRIYDDLGRGKDAIQYYEYVASLGENRKEYYAARAALQLGYIFELQKDKDKARYWFQRCLAMKNHDYKNSIDARARAGLARLEALN